LESSAKTEILTLLLLLTREIQANAMLNLLTVLTETLSIGSKPNTSSLVSQKIYGKWFSLKPTNTEKKLLTKLLVLSSLKAEILNKSLLLSNLSCKQV
jgi:hypothetical protein